MHFQMSPVWRKALPAPTNEEVARENVVKSSLTKGLAQGIRRLQQNLSSEDQPRAQAQAQAQARIIVDDEVTNSICHILEGIFIHGLKDTFIRRVTAILSGNIDKIPEPNFWPFLLVFTHKNVITQILNLNNVATDIGHCRAWLRIALNDGLLENYLSAMVKDKKTLQYYYSQTAYLRDAEQPDILRKYIESLRVLNFNLSCNVRTFNEWSATPLMLAGIWAPPIAPEPVTAGVDVASYLSKDGDLTPRRRRIRPIESDIEWSENVDPKAFSDAQFIVVVNGNAPDQHDSVSSSPASCPDPPPPIHNYDRMAPENSNASPTEGNLLENIEETVVHDASGYSREDLASSNDAADASSHSTTSGFWKNASKPAGSVPQTPSDAIRGITDGVAEAETGETLSHQPHVGNSLIGKNGWSSSYDDEDDHLRNPGCQSAMRESESFHSLLKNYSPVFGSVIRTPNFSEVVNMMSGGSGSPVEETPKSPMEDLEKSGFEVIPTNFSITSKYVDAQTLALKELIGKIQNEKGLDAQNFQCKGCRGPVGIIYGKARVCNYDGCYYCSDCHRNDEYVIPARVIHNWDFKKYKVSRNTKKFLEQIKEEPLIDIRKMNSSLYSAIDEMDEILCLRSQLSYLRSYLFTCRESVVENLRKRIWPKEYLYEHVHLYSLSDLQQVPNGNFAQTLRKVVSFASSHVISCRLCSQKGFVCEVCNNPKVIYPFQMDLIHRCESCLAVYHKECMSDKKPCPKCVRRQKQRKGQQDYLWTMDD